MKKGRFPANHFKFVVYLPEQHPRHAGAKQKMPMRKIFLLLGMIVGAFVSDLCAQNHTQKWNDFYKRIEYFDEHGHLTGYAKYNDFYKRWEYREP